MKISLGFSPCPNDTFIFDALVNKKIDSGGLQFNVVLEDVQTLNKWALQNKLDFTKISYGVLPIILNALAVVLVLLHEKWPVYVYLSLSAVLLQILHTYLNNPSLSLYRCLFHLYLAFFESLLMQ